MRYVCITIGGHYVHVPQLNVWGWVLADGQGQGDDTIFERRELGDGRVAFRSLSGFWLTDKPGVSETDPGEGGSFLEVWWPDDRISLRARNGMFLCAEGGGGGTVSCDRREAGPWEKFFYEVPAPELVPAPPAEPEPGPKLGDRLLDDKPRTYLRPGVSDRISDAGRRFP